MHVLKSVVPEIEVHLAWATLHIMPRRTFSTGMVVPACSMAPFANAEIALMRRLRCAAEAQRLSVEA